MPSRRSARRATRPLSSSACANDSTGRPEAAEPLYREALAAGLAGIRRRRAVIQLASTLRNLGHADESVALLSAERDGVGLALEALARHLPRYNRSLANYARELSSSPAS